MSFSFFLFTGVGRRGQPTLQTTVEILIHKRSEVLCIVIEGWKLWAVTISSYFILLPCSCCSSILSICSILTTQRKTRCERLRVEAAEMGYQEGVSLRDRVRGSAIHEELWEQPLLLCIERSQLRWFGHLVRMPRAAVDDGDKCVFCNNINMLMYCKCLK